MRVAGRKVGLGRKKPTSKPTKTEGRTDGFVSVGREENWQRTCREIEEYIRKYGPWGVRKTLV